jgi:hypothetical protein
VSASSIVVLLIEGKVDLSPILFPKFFVLIVDMEARVDLLKRILLKLLDLILKFLLKVHFGFVLELVLGLLHLKHLLRVY